MIKHRHPVPSLKADEFPSISAIFRTRTEKRIDDFVKRLDLLSLDGKEVRLVRDGDSATRIDLLGHYEEDGALAIIELKKSAQTERQAFTELLAYANQFCALFPSLSESSLSSILVVPRLPRYWEQLSGHSLHWTFIWTDNVAFRHFDNSNVLYPAEVQLQPVAAHSLSLLTRPIFCASRFERVYITT